MQSRLLTACSTSEQYIACNFAWREIFPAWKANHQFRVHYIAVSPWANGVTYKGLPQAPFIIHKILTMLGKAGVSCLNLNVHFAARMHKGGCHQ